MTAAVSGCRRCWRTTRCGQRSELDEITLTCRHVLALARSWPALSRAPTSHTYAEESSAEENDRGRFGHGSDLFVNHN